MCHSYTLSSRTIPYVCVCFDYDWDIWYENVLKRTESYGSVPQCTKRYSLVQNITETYMYWKNYFYLKNFPSSTYGNVLKRTETYENVRKRTAMYGTVLYRVVVYGMLQEVKHNFETNVFLQKGTET